ncbi:hypothetical protein T4E_6391 [Trichinella pseudospiralis]|uniref:Uncharacterized protein n=1 Tax=Trichinella pseudospiralis TaxID=6337 RepID=A0A0V0XDD5_TRIPS|nr:hypothetical protein T4E_6391 [Trichinella pseudospiralis]
MAFHVMKRKITEIPIRNHHMIIPSTVCSKRKERGTGRDPQRAGGAADDRRIALRANPKGLVPDTVLSRQGIATDVRAVRN